MTKHGLGSATATAAIVAAILPPYPTTFMPRKMKDGMFAFMKSHKLLVGLGAAGLLLYLLHRHSVSRA